MSGDNRRFLFSCLQADLSQYSVSDKTNPYERWQSVAATQLLGSIFKKYEDPNPRADARAIDLFLSVNETVGNWKWRSLGSWDDELLGIYKDSLAKFFEPGGQLNPLDLSKSACFLAGDVGPGASVQGGGGSFYQKFFTSRLTTTSSALYHAYLRLIARYPYWANAELIRWRKMGVALVVEGNRMSCVPKNVDISRTIATEPTLNMWFQLGAGNIIRGRLRRAFGLDIERQQFINRELARRGSLSSADDGLCTIDLSSASDTISLKLLEMCLPRYIYEELVDLRSGYCTLPDGRRVQLNMISTMGNGYTFPLQTVLFSCVVEAVYSQLGIPFTRCDSSTPTWGVFGDDIIVCRKAYDRVVHFLTSLGFVVNSSKSFKEGPFRESCGCDWFAGYNVRGVYLKRLELPQDFALAFNLLSEWSARTGVSLPITLHALLQKGPIRFVPRWEDAESGFRVPEWFARPKRTKTGSFAYKAWVPVSQRIEFPHYGLEGARHTKLRLVNPDGLLVSVCKGEFGDGVLTPRHRDRTFVSRRRIALSWENPPCDPDRLDRLWANPKAGRALSVGPVAGPVDGRRWESVFYYLS